ncbi:MAG: phage holin family protein [Cyclobacteriaceae bacterium]|nr:phage holin family protein [Cyclobacteriaceae bacterium]
MSQLIKLLLSGIAVFLTAYLLPGVHVDSIWVALVVSVVLSISNVLLKPVLIVLTIPFTIMTLGLFLLAINAITILIVDYFVPGFQVDGFWWALVFGIIVSLFTSMLAELTGTNKEK